MKAFKIKIVRFVSEDQPGFVECEFVDAWNKTHIIFEKVPVVTNEFLDADSGYPQSGVIACEILNLWTDKDHRKIVTVSTEKPWSIESVEGLCEFDLLKEWLVTI